MSRNVVVALALLPLGAAVAEGLNPRLSANFQHDWVSFDSPEPRPLRDVGDWRRMEVGLLADLPGGYGLKAEYDFEGEIWTDVYLRGPVGPLRITLGQFKTPFGMDFLTASRSQLFTENSVSGAFSIGRRLGVMGEWLKADRGVQVALYGSDIEGAGPDRGLTLRGFRALGDAEAGLWHLGADLASEEPQDASARIRLRPELRSPDPAWIDSGSLAGFERLDRAGVEAAWQRGDWWLQGEWQRGRYDVDGGARTLRGGYLQGSWTVHGSPRPYKDGVFNLPRPTAGFGQVELALRYSRIDVPLAAGGERRQQGWALGANAQFGPYLRLMVDRYAVDRDRNALDAQLWSVRAAFAF